MDVHSYARPDLVRVNHVSLHLAADFDMKILAGYVDLRFDRVDPRATKLILDTNDLNIVGVTGSDESARDFALGATDPNLGAPLEIELDPKDTWVRVIYRTSPTADAVLWLSPEQTDGKKKPFLFTQGQAILTRTWIPLQDSPGVRVSYDATITVPEDLGVTAVMSAEMRRDEGLGVYRFSMNKRIPSYLIALAIGELESRTISERCAVWAEPGVVDKAAAEFEDTEKMIKACEKAFGPYRFGRYDVLVLPPAFPFGGMENPCLTFATPTILAGDKSLVALIAHELAHSWSGNLVTNATWRDFWLNEGWTVYLEQRIVEILYGRPRAEMEMLHGLDGLDEELAELPKADQILHIDLAGRNPDDGMTSVPYDKGAAFLRRIEQVFGRVEFDEFARGYFAHFGFQSITTDQFLEYLATNLFKDDARATQIDVQDWVFGVGLPEDCPRPTSPAFRYVDNQRKAWLQGTAASALNTKDWVTMQWLYFLNEMPDNLGREQLDQLDASFRFTGTGNSEILFAWLQLGLKSDYKAIDARLEDFLMTVGRRKFLSPLYQELCKTEEGKVRAKAIYNKARARYHAVSQRTLDEIIGD